MPKPKRKLLYLGVKGHLLAVDAANGSEIWRTKLKGSGTVIVYRDDETLYASTHGELWCIDAESGSVRWTNPLKGLGYGIVSLATSAAEAAQSTAYVTIAEQMRQQAAQAAAASS